MIAPARSTRRSLSRAAPTAVAVAVALALAACTAGTRPGATPSAEPTVSPHSTRTPTASATPTPVAFDPAGGATGNVAYLDAVMAALLRENDNPDGRTIIDRLVGSGFPRADMEVTPDKTAVGLDADAIQFSVRFGDRCLVGQVGILGYSRIVAPLLGTGHCLVGKTRTIDW